MREMKDSGIEWIGEIPSDWGLSKIGAVYEERNEKVSDADFPPLSVTKQGVVPQLETAAKTNDGENRKLVKKNDFVINSRSDRRGSCGISEYDGSCSLINTVLKPRRNMCNAYYSFVFRSERFADEFYRWGNGIVDDLWSTKWSNMKRIYIPAPSLQEQRRITDYLDRKCSQIDAIIARQQEVIEKLKAYKLSVITEAVTKGLNPNVPMKDSGVEWIGEIPNSWVKVKLKNICQFINGDRSSNYPSPNEYVDDGIPFLGADSLCGRYVDITQSKKITKEKYYSMGGAKIHEGDILYTLRGSTIGKNAMATFNDGTVASSLMVIRPISIVPEYLLYWVNSEEEFQQRQSYINGSTAPNLSAENVGSFVMFLPSVAEQREIADYLDKKCTEIELTMLKKQMMADQLSNYKKSLIYEVVTGKKEV